ncbi:hypothetical protein INT47_008350 [Mucor saturninus]|uniref:Uncharacterized protein n=1 Tax=Mucor saturninus TaxID=64648 RepID=A0A8H7RH32_9FUNG|nr:hypothetical protein INT47_008350 [Mucor saturninus]
MKADYCVDYLSHCWNTDDLISTFQESRKQRQKYIIHPVTTTTFHINIESKSKKSEEYKSIRFQNALWRNMARHCTDNLCKSNKLVNPATVSWQKESDITWLYGPMYTNNKKNNCYGTQSSLQGLKPVLKKQSNVTQSLPTCSDSLNIYDFDPTYTVSEFGYTSSSSSITSGLCSTRSSFSSVSSSKSTASSSSVGVHFNPEIIEIEYQPEYPVSLKSYYQHHGGVHDDDDDDDEDDTLWPLLLQASESLKSSTYTRISSVFSKGLYLVGQKKTHPNHSLHLVILMASMMKSVVSLTTTWVLYQSLSPLSSWLAPKPLDTTAGQSPKQSKKARLIIL